MNNTKPKRFNHRATLKESKVIFPHSCDLYLECEILYTLKTFHQPNTMPLFFLFSYAYLLPFLLKQYGHLEINICKVQNIYIYSLSHLTIFLFSLCIGNTLNLPLFSNFPLLNLFNYSLAFQSLFLQLTLHERMCGLQ